MTVDRAELAAVFAGGFAGAVARAGLVEALPHSGDGWPWATFVANVLGCLLLGAVVAWLPRPGHRRALLGAGFCGALTTFSTLQLEVLELLDGGQGLLAAAYLAASLTAGLGAVAVGSRARVAA